MLSKIFNLLVALMLFATLFVSIDDSNRIWTNKDETTTLSVESIAGGPDISSGIFSEYIFSFELLSLLLIAALIGALFLAKKEV